MCGIFGYSGLERDATRTVFEGLARLDYRGYDSWGVSVLAGPKLITNKFVGLVDGKKLKLPKSSVAIGHTRWATNGAVTVKNAHPHVASDGSFVLTQNGIVENFSEIKKSLVAKGYKFYSDTDTEVIVRLIEDKRKKSKNFAEAARRAGKQLEGRNTFVILTKTGQIVAVKNGSPLIVGISKNSEEIFFSSDTLSFAPYVSQIIVLENGQIAVYNHKKLEILSMQNGKKAKYKIEKNTLNNNSQIDKNGYEHFMLKEIYEEPSVIRRIAEQSDESYQRLARAIIKANNIYCIGSGTAGAAAAQTSFYLRSLANIQATGLIGAEAGDYYNLIKNNDLVIAPSQSGETADVLEVIETVKKSGVKIASFVNMPGSMMTRLSDYKFMAEAGPEICVMSTKVFVSQLAWGYLVAKAVQGRLKQGKINLQQLSESVEDYLSNKALVSKIKRLAKILAYKPHIFLLAKGQNLQIIKEGMVKIIEGSYAHAHAIAAGDLKHYAITLMEPGVSVIFVISNDSVRKDVINALNEVKARGAKIIAIAPEHEKEMDEHIRVPDTGETSAIMNIIPLQLLAYYMAVELKHNVDKPRNIAKSVTVK